MLILVSITCSHPILPLFFQVTLSWCTFFCSECETYVTLCYSPPMCKIVPAWVKTFDMFLIFWLLCYQWSFIFFDGCHRQTMWAQIDTIVFFNLSLRILGAHLYCFTLCTNLLSKVFVVANTIFCDWRWK